MLFVTLGNRVTEVPAHFADDLEEITRRTFDGGAALFHEDVLNGEAFAAKRSRDRVKSVENFVDAGKRMVTVKFGKS